MLSSSIPLNETKAPRDFFVGKVVSSICQRWHALYFDAELLLQDTINVNMFQMLMLAAHRFTVLVEMLPFVNRDMRFFHESIHQILSKMAKTIHRSLGPGSATKKTSRSYLFQKHQVRSTPIPCRRMLVLNYVVAQVWAIGLYAFQLTILAKRDQVHAKHHQCQWAGWHTLLNAVRTEQEEFMQLAEKCQGTERRSTLDLDWLLHDRRNTAVLKHLLQLGVNGSSDTRRS